jgi:hypothetical protein
MGVSSINEKNAVVLLGNFRFLQTGIEPSVINNLVSFAAITSAVRTINSTSGCPSGFVGRFTLNARLTDKGGNPSLAALKAKVMTLTNGDTSYARASASVRSKTSDLHTGNGRQQAIA